MANDYLKIVAVPATDSPILNSAFGTSALSQINPPFTALLVNGPAHGKLELHTDGSFAYFPEVDFVGTDSFTYQDGWATTAADGTTPIVSNIATVTIKVVPAIAHNDQYQVLQDTTLDIHKPGFLSTTPAAPPLIRLLPSRLVARFTAR